MSFGESLKTLREKKKLTQKDLARFLNISRQSISKWEQGISYPSILYLIPLTEVLDCTLEDLLKKLN
ncbi:MAG: helix-turn-helix transcriptional regulator [Bacilli bacterium]|nr:helix-turn-helix transcriptional regulator [Bacilli bacterium]